MSTLGATQLRSTFQKCGVIVEVDQSLTVAPPKKPVTLGRIRAFVPRRARKDGVREFLFAGA